MSMEVVLTPCPSNLRQSIAYSKLLTIVNSAVCTSPQFNQDYHNQIAGKASNPISFRIILAPCAMLHS